MIVCGYAVLEHGEVVLGEVGDEASVRVAGDDVGGDRVTPDRNVGCGGGVCAAGRPTTPTPDANAARRRASRDRWTNFTRDYTRPVYATLAARFFAPVPPGAAPASPALSPGAGGDRLALTRAGRLARAACGPGDLCRGGPLGDLVGAVPLLGERARRHAARRAGRRRRARRPALHRSLAARSPTRWSRRPRRSSSAPPARRGAAGTLQGWTIALRGLDRAASYIAASPTCSRREADGRAPDRVRRQQQPAELRPDERRGMGRRAAGAMCATSTAPSRRRGACWCAAGITTASASGRSIPGASWVFPLDTLDKLGAFLAVRMNGEPLPLDHGAPVRLVVPGWYGCAWIKWVNEIRLGRRRRAADLADAGVRGPHASGAACRRWRATTSRPRSTSPRCRCGSRSGGRRPARIPVVGIVWGGDRPVDG